MRHAVAEYLWTAFVANSSGQNVLVSASPDGATWQPNLDINQATGFAPSLAMFKGRLYAAFIANDSGQNVLIHSTADGIHWAPLNGAAGAAADIHQASGSAPSLAVFKDRLWVAFIANDSGNNVLVCSSNLDGSFPPGNLDIQQASNGSAPSLAVCNGRLYVAFIANNSGQNVLIYSTGDGVSWKPLNGKAGDNADIHQASNGSAPSLAAFGPNLWVAYIANNSGNNVLVSSSANGFASNQDIQQASNGWAPSLAVFNGRLYVAFIANDSGQNVLVCSSAEGQDWEPLNGTAGNNPDIHQASGFAPSLAVAPFSYWPISPTGLTSNFNYFFTREDRHDILGLSITITPSEDMVFDAASGHFTGFSFQLNAYSHTNPNCAFQQYTLDCVNGELTGVINIFDVNQNVVLNDQQGLASISGGRLRANTKLTITLLYDTEDRVIGATFTVPNGQGQLKSTVMPSNLPTENTAAIVAFQLNIVGPFNSESAVLTSGAGTIGYSAANGLVAGTNRPTFAEFGHGRTAETANTFYGTLPSTESHTFSQTFKVGSVPA